MKRPTTGGPKTVEELYERRLKEAYNITEHMKTLYLYASGCNHVTEFGVWLGYSTTAFLRAYPRKLVSYDPVRLAEVDMLEELAAKGGRTEFMFRQMSSLDGPIEPTDLLLIDSPHYYEHCIAELRMHGSSVGKYLIFHDTEAMHDRAHADDLKSHPGISGKGIWPAVSEFLRSNDEWRLHHHYENQYGLTILTRPHRS
jgi:hypothetical protein